MRDLRVALETTLFLLKVRSERKNEPYTIPSFLCDFNVPVHARNAHSRI